MNVLRKKRNFHLLFNLWLYVVSLTIKDIFSGDKNLALKGLAFRLIYCSMYTVYIFIWCMKGTQL